MYQRLIHVNDIARAHYYGLKNLKIKCTLTYNIGTEESFSFRDT